MPPLNRLILIFINFLVLFQDFEEFPEHRTNFFLMLQSVNHHCFASFLSIPAPQFKLVLDSIIWAFKHTMRNVADTGLNILKQLLQVSTKWGGGGLKGTGFRIMLLRINVFRFRINFGSSLISAIFFLPDPHPPC